MDEKQETFTRAEVERLLLTQANNTKEIIREHFEAERARRLAPVWVSVTLIVIGAVSLWVLATVAL
jgi:hypothetical protein